jgi:hypothetical protein
MRENVLRWKSQPFAKITQSKAGATPTQHALQAAEIANQFRDPQIQYPLLTRRLCRQNDAKHDFGLRNGGSNDHFLQKAAQIGREWRQKPLRT